MNGLVIIFFGKWPWNKRDNALWGVHHQEWMDFVDDSSCLHIVHSFLVMDTVEGIIPYVIHFNHFLSEHILRLQLC